MENLLDEELKKQETIQELKQKTEEIINKDKFKNLYQKLNVIQEKIKGLSKDKKGFNYEYVTGNKVLGFIKPIMSELGLLLKQEVIKVEKERIDYIAKGKDKSEMLYQVWQKFTWIDCETGEKDENLFYASGMNDWEKGLGSALTYAERYFLLKYFHIPTDEDDIDNTDRKENEQIKKNKTDQEIKQDAINYINNNNDNLEFLENKLSEFKVKNLKELNIQQLKQICVEIKKNKNK